MPQHIVFCVLFSCASVYLAWFHLFQFVLQNLWRTNKCLHVNRHIYLPIELPSRFKDHPKPWSWFPNQLFKRKIRKDLCCKHHAKWLLGIIGTRRRDLQNIYQKKNSKNWKILEFWSSNFSQSKESIGLHVYKSATS